MTQSARDDSARTPVATTVTAPAPVHPGADAAGGGEALPAQHRDSAPHKAQPPATGPALTRPTWSGKKTAVAAALAIGLSSVGTIGAAAALPEGASSESGLGGRQIGPGGGQQPWRGGSQQSDPSAATT
jgi:hypothetical protein